MQIPVLEILQEDAAHTIPQTDAVVILLELFLGLLVRADLSPVVRQGEGGVDALDDPSEDGVGVHEVVAQLVQAVDVTLLVPKNTVVIVAGEVAAGR